MISALKNKVKHFEIGLLLICFLGVLFRFFQITKSQFVYYDEGLYLDINRKFITLVAANFPKNSAEFFQTLKLLFYLSLATGKAFWIFLSDTRVYFLGVDAWYFPRVLSALFGSLSIIVMYFFGKNLFKSRTAGLLCAALLAILPSHVYYSRLAMQEAASTFCFLLGMYLYLFPRKFSWRTIVAGILFGCVFFTNYRMIVTPALVLAAELVYSFGFKEKLRIRNYLWSMIVFGGMVVLIGNLYEARNTVLTFMWMFHQGQLAEGHFEFFDLFSFPFYQFYLESIWFGLLLWGNIYFIIRRQWGKLLTFSVVLVQMAIFSFVQEKAVRYVCVVMPFMVLSVVAFVLDIWQSKEEKLKIALAVVLLCLIVNQIYRVFQIAGISNDYQSSMSFVADKGPGKVLSTQNYIHKLYVSLNEEVLPAPHSVESLLKYYFKGYRYLMIDPQAYISYTADQKRFSPPLDNDLETIVRLVEPIKVFPHFDRAQLERFVLEHNENLRQSLAFLSSEMTKDGLPLRVYEIKDCLSLFSRMKK